jgi:hypothetical protein
MDWMVLTELSSMFYGPWHAAEPTGDSGSPPSETDLWITRQAYEFMAARTLCDRCGAHLGRTVSVSPIPQLGAAWQLAVRARCCHWRRHLHRALVSQGADGLRFGAWEPS